MPVDANASAGRPQPGLGQSAFNTLLILAFGCGMQTATAPTVTVSCPARTAVAPDCTLRWLVAFDLVPVRSVALTALQAVDEVEALGSNSRRPGSGMSTFTFYFRSAAGRTRVIPLGDQTELRAFREPIVKYLQDVHAPPLQVTMWPSSAPWRPFASVVIGLGLLQGAYIATRLLRGDVSRTAAPLY